ncbi:MAG: helix-turn-helix domain-containing protein [Hydrogeniiclostridium sp.]
MENKPLKNKKFFDLYKYIFSYIMAASLPLVIVIVIFGTVFTQAYQREVEANQSSSLLSAQNSVELMLSQMENIVQMIQLEEDYSYDLDDQLPKAISLQKRLRRYQLSSGYLKDILFYTHGNTSICASSSTYSLDTYADSVNKMTGISPETFTKYLNETDSLVILPAHTEKMVGSPERKVVDFIYPLPYLTAAPYATVLFKIDAETLQKAFHAENYANYAAVLPSGKERVLLAGSETYEEELQTLIDTYSFDDKQSSFIAQLNGQEYMVSYLRNPDTDILYLYILPSSSALEPVYKIQRTLYGVLASMLLIECLLVFLVAYKNYRPIRSLQEFLFKHYPEPPIELPRQSSAIENAEHLLNHMAVVHKNLNEKLAVNQETLREAVLYKAVNGGFSSLDELNTTYENSGLLITNPYLRILMVRASPHQDGKSPMAAELLAILRNRLLNQQIYHCFFSAKNVFLIADSSGKDSIYREILPGICLDLKQKLPHTEIYMGMSSSVADVSKLHMTYIEASAALDTALEKGIPDTPVFYSEIVSHKEIEQLYPYEEINELSRVIQENNKEKLQGLVSRISALLKTHQYNLILGKLVCYDVMSVILKATLQTGKGFSIINERAPDIMGLSSSHSMEELLRILEDITQKTMKYLDEKEQPNNNLMEQIIAIINANVFDYNFSVGQLADQFGISQNNLSQRFKRYLNQTPTEYINRLKMEKAKSFLSNTDMPLRMIVEKLGYSNESSFIRKFKDATGMTPGEYRRQSRGPLL